MLLALDTSTLTLDLALVDGAGAVRAHVIEGPPRRQSERLPELVVELLAAQHLALCDLTGFVVGLGPGSFTGLRIGLATLKGLAYALERPLAGVSSLAALALEGPPDAELWPVAVVKRGDLYVGRYRRCADARTGPAAVELLEPETSLTVEALARELRLAAGRGVRMLGPALESVRGELLERGVPGECLLDAPRWPSAPALARLAPPLPPYRKEDVFALEPRYLRGSGAEENPKFPPLPGAEPRARLKEEDP